MKTAIVRLSVLVLATSGFAVSTLTTNVAAKTKVVAPIVANIPFPQCMPHDPSMCGLRGY